MSDYQKTKNAMPVLKFNNIPYEEVKPGLKRKIIYTDNLMSVLIDFSNGPWSEPEPPHSHPHEQISYLVSGELIFYCEGEDEKHLIAGDMFAVPSGRKHTIKLLTKEVRLIDNFTPIREDFLK